MISTAVLLRRREALGLTQEALARAVGIDRTFYSKVERGLATPGTETLIRLYRALDLSSEERQELEAQLVPPASPVAAAVAPIVA